MNDKDIRTQVVPYLRDDIDSVEITIPQGLVRKLLEIRMFQQHEIEALQKRNKRLNAVLDRLADPLYTWVKQDDGGLPFAEISARIEYARNRGESD